MMQKKQLLIVPSEQSNSRIDKFLAQSLPDVSRSSLLHLFLEHNITLNGKAAAKNARLKVGDAVEVLLPELKELEAKPEDIPLDIVFEDDDIIIVNKPKGMVVHPSNGHKNGTLVNALLAHCAGELSGINGVIRPGIVHRIDKDTSGLLMVAKNNNAHLKLAEQIKSHSFCREYAAIVYGNFKELEGEISLPIGRSPIDRKKMAITDKNSNPAVTYFKVLYNFKDFAYLRLTLKTGRTHQIRVHMAHIGHPVAGDTVYGPKKVIAELNGQCLHAIHLGFVHPKTGKYLQFETQLPDYFKQFLNRLKGK